MARILIIVPAYNEQDNITNTLMMIKNANVDYIVVNDCSTDNTKEILDSVNAEYINLPLNLEIGGGVQAGYMYACENGYDIAVQCDGDGQHDIAYLDDIVQPIISGEADCVVGSRYIDKEGFQSSALRRLGIRFLSDLIKICTGKRIKDVTSGFRAVNKKYIKIFAKEYAQDYPEPEAIVLEARYGARIKEVPVVMKERENGSSSISGAESVYYMVKVSLSIILLNISLRKRVKR